MSALPYLQLYPADYLADTAHLTAAEHGAYLLLIMNYWQRGKPLCNRGQRLAHVARMTAEEWEACRDTLAEFFEVNGDEWRHPRIEEDLMRVSDNLDKSRKAGKASADRRKTIPLAVEPEQPASPQTTGGGGDVENGASNFNACSTDVQRTFNGCSTDVQRMFNGRSTDVQRTFNERSTNKILEDISSTPPPKSPPLPGGGVPEPVSGRRRKRQDGGSDPPESKKTFVQWVADTKARGERAISDYRPVWEYSERVGLPRDFVEIAWLKFRERFEAGSRKRYVDWRMAFLRYVQGNYFRLWFWADSEGVFKLTTAGVQADRETREGAGAA